MCKITRSVRKNIFIKYTFCVISKQFLWHFYPLENFTLDWFFLHLAEKNGIKWEKFPSGNFLQLVTIFVEFSKSESVIDFCTECDDFRAIGNVGVYSTLHLIQLTNLPIANLYTILSKCQNDYEHWDGSAV